LSFDAQHLYELLPVLYRLRDAGQGEPLKALLSVIAEQVVAVEDNLDLLYDDLFIETCADWVVPYIGDLIGYKPLHGTTATIRSRRAEVANTIAYRRRKGTAYVLGLLAQDVTGWPAHVTEYFRQLNTTQYMKHLRPGNTLLDVHAWSAAEDINTAFDKTNRSVDVRRIASGRGRYNIPNIGVFVWRLRPYPVNHGTARKITASTFTFNPLGLDIRLFNPALTAEPLAQVSQPLNIPAPLSRRRMFDELEARRQAIASSTPVLDAVFFGTPPPFAIFLNGVQIPSQEIQICNLSAWTLPDATKQYAVNPLDPASSKLGLPIQAAVDPELGRIAFPAAKNLTTVQVEVDYAYGFSGDYGAGPYARADYQHSASAVHVPGKTIAAALTSLGAAAGIVEIDDSHTYAGDVAIAPAAGQHITFRAADRTRPVIDGKITITPAPGSAVTLDGLLISGGVTVTSKDDCSLIVASCTVLPFAGAPAISWTATGGGQLTIDHTLCGALRIDDEVRIALRDTLVDSGDFKTVAFAKTDTTSCGRLDIARCTVRGGILARETELIENSILNGVVTFDRTQSGCVRFTWLPTESKAPRRFECQPDAAIQHAIDAQTIGKKKQPTQVQIDEITAGVKLWLKPVFTETADGKAAFFQLHKSCPVEITTGADDGAEMGIFHDLYQPQRLSNLAMRLDEYLRVGLEPGVVTEN
jgi:hypothetical protein